MKTATKCTIKYFRQTRYRKLLLHALYNKEVSFAMIFVSYYINIRTILLANSYEVMIKIMRR